MGLRKYIRKTYRFKNAIEIYEHLDGRYGARGAPRKEKIKATPEEVKKRNQWNRERTARHKLRTWFRENDYLLTFTYRKADRPPDMKTAKKHFRSAYTMMRKEYRKRGYELRWMRNIEVGTKGAYHIHVVVNRIPDADLIAKKAWPYGGANIKLLYEQGEFKELAEYITKTPDTDPRLREADYSTSRHLPIEEPKKKRLTRWPKEPKEPKGYYLDKDSFHEGSNPFTGCRYRYYTLIAIHRRI